MKQSTVKIETVGISDVIMNPGNPRIIKDEKFKQLVESIKSFPEMLNIRPIVVNDDMVVLGGNMRLMACKSAGLSEVPIIKASNLTEEQQREFIIKDNVGFGEWDWSALANEWETDKLSEWGLDIPGVGQAFGDKNKEIDTDSFEDKCVITLNYTMDEYNLVKEALHKIAPTPEQAIWQVLKLDGDE